MRWLLLWTALGAWLRFQGLDRPLWTDEALFGFMVKDGAYQEYLAVWLTWIWRRGAGTARYYFYATCPNASLGHDYRHELWLAPMSEKEAGLGHRNRFRRLPTA